MPGRLAAALVGLTLAALTPPLTAAAQPQSFDLQAHAGGRGETTGESLRAFAKSLEIGVSTLELDIVITKDEQPLVWHDPIIDADKCSDTTAAYPGDPAYPYVGKLVHDLTLAQLRTLDCGKPSREFPTAEVVRGDRLATLPEIFALAGPRDVRFNIETKVEADRPGLSADPQESVDVVLAAVRSAGQVDRVEIQSFDWRTLRIISAAEPSIPLVALWNEQTWVAGSPWLAGVDPGVVGDPMIGALLVGASIVSPQFALVDPALIDRAHSLGLKVIPRTVDNADTMRELIGEGVDGIITNYPRLLRTVLSESGVPLSA